MLLHVEIQKPHNSFSIQFTSYRNIMSPSMFVLSCKQLFIKCCTIYKFILRLPFLFRLMLWIFFQFPSSIPSGSGSCCGFFSFSGSSCEPGSNCGHAPFPNPICVSWSNCTVWGCGTLGFLTITDVL